MDIFGIGAPELIFIIIIALIVLGPKDMEKTGKTIGKWLRNTVTSDSWKLLQQTTRELRTLPNRLMRETNEDINKIGNELNAAINTPENRRSTLVQSSAFEDGPAGSTSDTFETKSRDDQETNA